MNREDHDAIESLVTEYFAVNGPVPDHSVPGARREWFMELVAHLKENKFGSDFIFYSSSENSAWHLIMSASFRKGSKALRPNQKGLRDNIVTDLRAAISLVYKEERLAKAKHEAPEKEILPDLPEQIEVEPEPVQAEEYKPAKKTEEKEVDYSASAKQFTSASEANAALKKLKAGAPKIERVTDPIWDAALGFKKEEE